ncbi:MAG: Shedu immune nuclease family protein [Acidobacteriota bacterium]
MSLPADIDPNDLSQTGWGVIFVEEEADEMRQRLRRLLERRKAQAGTVYRELTYRKIESARRFLSRHGEVPGAIDPGKVPYYLLIVGSPRDIAFDFQYHLSISHAVGRLTFDDLAAYEAYAESLVAVEVDGSNLPRRASMFSPDLSGDKAIQRLKNHFVEPLTSNLRNYAGWEIDVWSRGRAFKKSLAELIGGSKAPALLMIASHGRRLRPLHPQQETLQGSVACQGEGGAGSKEHPTLQFFAPSDLSAKARCSGQILFMFSDFGAGTPVLDSFPDEEPNRLGEPRVVAKRAFVSRLAQQILGAGAMALVGRVDRGWTVSFEWEAEGQLIEGGQYIEDAIKRLLDGMRLGHAMRPFYRRYAALAASLAELLDRARLGVKVSSEMLGSQWTAFNDARNFIVLGDPATCFPSRASRSEDRSPDAKQSASSPAAADNHLLENRTRSGPIYLTGSTYHYALRESASMGLQLDRWVNRVLGEHRAKQEARGVVAEEWFRKVLRAHSVIDEFSRMLKSVDDEEAFQVFFKMNPELLYPGHVRIIPKMPLGSEYVTDFVVEIESRGASDYVFVEIERPGKRVFVKEGHFSAPFTQAKDQLLDWEDWVRRNIAYLKQELPDLHSPKFLLVMGRSQGLDSKMRRKLQEEFSGSSREFLTYDDLLTRYERLYEQFAREYEEIESS